MLTVSSLHLVFSFMEIINEPLESNVWNMIWGQIKTFPANSGRPIFYKLTIQSWRRSGTLRLCSINLT